MAFYTSKKVVLIAMVALILSCSTSPRYNRNTQIIPQQETKHTVEKPPVDNLQQLPENNALETVAVNNQDTVPATTEEIVNKGTDTAYTFYQQGVATYYADKFQGHKTAFGERYDKKQYTAAHRTLPHNSMVRVTALSNNKSVIVRINDRGPFTRNRVIDLSKAAAKDIDLLAHGIMKVTIETIEVK